ncbi:response regulator [Halobacteriovorax sp. HLS]|uniref:response regulator n=1 Tax=Halobacteriovorax sp. HLS TaxID=2234000 RepID=UPI000FDC0B49|nr:response regulator [Halobacteriovorax sp. HLS]
MSKILIVDDEEMLADCLKDEFEFLGHEVTVFNDPEVVCKQPSIPSFDVIILDIKMPRMNGIELYEIIKPKSKAKFVFLSAISDMMSQESALKKADLILEKPFSLEDIKKIVDLAK